MICAHCGLTKVYYEGRIERCWICGYWNDPKFPLRLATAQDKMDSLDKAELLAHVSSMPIVFGNNGRPRTLLDEERLEKRRETNRKSQRTYWANHPEARQKKRTDYSAYLDGEHYGIGRDKVHG
jgi:hypothetical protein